MHPCARGLLATSTLSLLLFSSCKSHEETATRITKMQQFFGDGWLAWSTAERTEYVETYIDAYSEAYYDACRKGEDIVTDAYPPKGPPAPGTLPYEKGDEDSTDVLLTHCLNSGAKYSLGNRDDEGIRTTPYAEIITKMYEQHPDSRSAPYNLLMPLLSDGNAQTSEALYKKQLGQWPNARYRPGT